MVMPRPESRSRIWGYNVGEALDLEASASSSANELVLDVRQNGAEAPAGFFEELRVKLSTLQRLEIAGNAPLASHLVRHVLQCLREATPGPTPPLLLRAHTLGDIDEAQRLLTAIPGVTVRLDCEGQPDFAEFQRCVDLCRTCACAFEVAFLVEPANWYEVGPLVTVCEEAQVHLFLRAATAEGRCPLAELPADEIRFLCLALSAERERFTSGRPYPSVSLQEYDRFLEECRAAHHKRTEQALRGGPAEPAVGTALRLPSFAHALLRNESSTTALLRLLGRIVDSPAVGAWIHEVVSTSDFAAQARERFSLRWLALWGDAIFHDPVALLALRAIYGDETGIDRLLQEDWAETARLGLESSVGIWRRHHGLDRVTQRQPPFVVPTIVPQAKKIGTPDVTVLIPSYNHEAYVEMAIRSVLAQTYPHFRVVVADDCSFDATVDNVKKVADERVEITVRPRNVGLGNNVVDALAQIDTPYIAILNSDDFFHPERLERCRCALEERPDAVIAATGIALVDAHGRSLTSASTVPLLDGPEIASWVSWYDEALRNAAKAHSWIGPLLQHNFLATSSNLFCRTSFLRRRIATLRNLKYCLDWQLFLDAAFEDALVYLPEELVAYRLHTSNTVWFREGGRWSYLLEVNRVFAMALRRLLDRFGQEQKGERGLDLVLNLLVEHVAYNTEVDGFVLFLQEFLQKSACEGVPYSPQIRKLLEALERGALERRKAIQLGRTIGNDIASLFSLRNEVSYLRLLRNRGEVAEDAVSNSRGVEAFLRAYLERLETEKSRFLSELEVRRHAVQELEFTKSGLEGERDSLQAMLACEQTARVAEKRHSREQIDRLYASREWEIGNFLWNRLGLAKIARSAAQRLGRVRDRKNRYTLALTRTMHWPRAARHRAVVAACWDFPIYFNTFVYQEMQALRKAGFGVKVFCWKTNTHRDLHPAFRDLWRNRVVLQVDWSVHQEDAAYFRRTRPERVQSFLVQLAAETGLTTETLMQDATVLLGFTFARHVELAGADYLHSYFFYDQSFMVMMAAYLLGIPRGITAYADHMLADYPFKCVRLHIELADIVVATSKRIWNELSTIGGGRFDRKILVKPNGIDVFRFPYVDPARRVVTGDTPELIAVNRIEPKKGLIYLAEAIRILADRGVKLRLNLVGSRDPYAVTSAEYAEELTVKVEELGIADCVVMHGVKKQPEIVALLARSCIFVAPYVEVASGDKDGIPTAMLEAMSTGLPIVTTDAGSIPEAVTDGVEALCVPQKDPVRLADAIERLLRDSVLRARLGEAGRRRVEAEYSVAVTERHLHERIKPLLDGARR
ncbi:MAG: glycosyltransferase [Deltaproteobacteria bacterium]|nr:glycosyltransferase [Deltaproteobacteria bacterium]